MSKNPFATAMADEYVHHRSPPPPKERAVKEVPPSYDEVAGALKLREYPREKADRPPRPERPERTDRKPADRDRERARRHRERERERERDRDHDRDHDRERRPQRSHSDSARHRSERERRHRRKLPLKHVEPHKPKNLDVIDKLDVSAFYGGKFHHDGPFDACTPHRNKNVNKPPVEAFPADGPNSSMKAFRTNNDHVSVAFGNGEDHNEIVGIAGSTAPRRDDPSLYPPRLNPLVVAFDSNATSTPVHGPSTAGLGSTTFLDGAPAPRADDHLQVPNGLGRKKLLVQRLRKNSTDHPRRASQDAPERPIDDDGPGLSLLRRVKSLKVGRR